MKLCFILFLVVNLLCFCLAKFYRLSLHLMSFQSLKIYRIERVFLDFNFFWKFMSLLLNLVLSFYFVKRFIPSLFLLSGFIDDLMFLFSQSLLYSLYSVKPASYLFSWIFLNCLFFKSFKFDFKIYYWINF